MVPVLTRTLGIKIELDYIINMKRRELIKAAYWFLSAGVDAANARDWSDSEEEWKELDEIAWAWWRLESYVARVLD